VKTPREILFERHRRTEPRLDEVRRQVLAALPASRGAYSALSRLQVGAPSVLRKAWLELIWPSRRAWAGMAGLWLAVAAANLGMRATSPVAPGVRRAAFREVAQAFEEQRRLLAELLPPAKPPATEPVRSSPRPRSERTVTFKAC
jgi:hypothetical protein